MSNIGIEKRDIDLIDWRKVSTNLVTGLEKDQQRRDTLKKEIEDNTRKLEDDIARTPVGNNDKANAWVINYSTKATESLLAMHRALKNGAVDPREYSTFTANAKSSTSQIFDSIKAFNEASKLANDRSQQGISSKQETQMMALVESFADLDKSTTIFQSDGTSQIVKLQDGKQVDGADGRITANQLMGLIGTRVDKYDLNASTAAAVKQVGDYVNETLTSPGGKEALAIITKIKDPSKLGALGPDGERIGKQWLKTEQLLTDQMLASPWNISSVLYDHSSGQYQMTLDPQKAASDKNFVLYSYVGGKLQPNFDTENGKKQKLIAEGIVKDKIRSQIGQEITTQTTKPQIEPKEPIQYAPPYVYEANSKAKEQQAVADAWVGLRTAKTPADLDAYRQAILGSPVVKNTPAGAPRLYDIRFDNEADPSKPPTKVVLLLDNGDKRTVALSSDPAIWALSGSEVHGIVDEGKLRKTYGGKKFTNAIEQFGNTMGAGVKMAEAPLITDKVLAEESSKATPAINVLLEGTGFVAVDEGTVWGTSTKARNGVSIYAVDKKTGKKTGGPLGTISTKGSMSVDEANQALSRIFSGL